jgi:hypothetical protein
MKFLKRYNQIFETKKTEEEGLTVLNNREIQDATEVLNKIKSLGATLGDNQKNMVAMCVLYSNNIETLKSIFDEYNELIKSQKIKPLVVKEKGTVISVDDKQYKTGDLLGFAEYIHSKKPKVFSGEKGTINFDSKEAPIWEGNGIEIYDGNSVESCIRYTGAGTHGGTLTNKPYDFCIGKYVGNGNMWQSYRDTKTSTFYFIVDKNKELDNPLHMVVYDNTINGVELTDATNNTGTIAEYGSDVSKYQQYLKSKGVPVDTLLINKPKTAQEIADDKILSKQNSSLEWYIKLPIEYRSRYVGRGHLLTDEQFKWLMTNPNINQ